MHAVLKDKQVQKNYDNLTATDRENIARDSFRRATRKVIKSLAISDATSSTPINTPSNIGKPKNEDVTPQDSVSVAESEVISNFSRKDEGLSEAVLELHRNKLEKNRESKISRTDRSRQSKVSSSQKKIPINSVFSSKRSVARSKTTLQEEEIEVDISTTSKRNQEANLVEVQHACRERVKPHKKRKM